MSRGKNTVQIDTSFARAAKLLTKMDSAVEIDLVGCGGTGSWVAPSIARLVRALRESGRPATARFIDPDYVELKNIGRQNFCDAEMGLSKSVCLAARYNAAWGLGISAIVGRMSEEIGRPATYGSMRILVGCVDNANGRKAMHQVLRSNQQETAPDIWWLDAGNAKSSGCILLGSAVKVEHLQGAFVSQKTCRSLPSPALVEPGLLIPKPEERQAAKMSCAEMMLANQQSLMVNQMVAAHLADYLYRLTFGDLRRFRTEFDLASGVAKSAYITPEAIAGVLNRPIESLHLMRGAK